MKTRARHVKKKLEQAKWQGKHKVACQLAGALADWLSERSNCDAEDVNIFLKS